MSNTINKNIQLACFYIIIMLLYEYMYNTYSLLHIVRIC